MLIKVTKSAAWTKKKNFIFAYSGRRDVLCPFSQKLLDTLEGAAFRVALRDMPDKWKHAC